MIDQESTLSALLEHCARAATAWVALQQQLARARHSHAAFCHFMAECMRKFGEAAQEADRQAAAQGQPPPRRPLRGLDLPRLAEFLELDFSKVGTTECTNARTNELKKLTIVFFES